MAVGRRDGEAEEPVDFAMDDFISFLAAANTSRTPWLLRWTSRSRREKRARASTAAAAAQQPQFKTISATRAAAAAAAAASAANGGDCPGALGTGVESTSAVKRGLRVEDEVTASSASSASTSFPSTGDLPTVWPPAIVLVIGGPGSGKGTLSAALATRAGAVHLSAGELLRAEAARPTAAGAAIDALLRRGDIVPSEVTVRLLHEAMCRAAGGKVHGGGGASESGDDAGNNDGAWRSARFVIDGFPRNGSNREAWTAAGGRPAAVLELVVPPAVLRSRLLGRGEGRADDTASVVERRLAVAAAEGGGVANW
eukprot:contig_30817_g7538